MGFVTKEQILDQIARTAAENGGTPLGANRFRTVTGIREVDWKGKYWARWGDALREAGFVPNSFQQGYGLDFMMTKLAALSRELGHFPVAAEIQLKARSDTFFPARKTFERYGSKRELVAKLAEFCQANSGFEDVLEFCRPALEHSAVDSRGAANTKAEVLGTVYLLKSGRYYKIGRSNAVGRRKRELQIQLPERAVLVHAINTDDPAGIEGYGPASFDRTHAVTLLHNWDLPFGKGRRYLSNAGKGVDALAGGWRLSGVHTVYSGVAFTPQISSAPLVNADFNSFRPDMVGDPHVSNQSADLWFNPAAYTAPQAPYRNGDASKGSLCSTSWRSTRHACADLERLAFWRCLSQK